MEQRKIAIKFWKDFKFWNIPNQNYSRILPKIIPDFGIIKNPSKIQNYSNPFILAVYRLLKSFQKLFLTRMRRRARVFTWKNISPIGDIYFSNVNSLEELELFQIKNSKAAKNYDASPCSPCGAARCNSSATKVLICG